jgi:hypothetical protein
MMGEICVTIQCREVSGDVKRCEDVRLWLFEVEFLVELLKQSRLKIAEEYLLGESEETHGSEWVFIYTKLCSVMLMCEYPIC